MKKVLFKQEWERGKSTFPMHKEVKEYILANPELGQNTPIYMTVLVNHSEKRETTGRILAMVGNGNFVITNNPFPESVGVSFKMGAHFRDTILWQAENIPWGENRDLALLAKSQDYILEVFIEPEATNNKLLAGMLTKENL